jgi:hypothetical protein
MLLDLLAKNLAFTFSSYSLLPMGSFSKIERLTDHSIFEL